VYRPAEDAKPSAIRFLPYRPVEQVAAGGSLAAAREIVTENRPSAV